MPYQVSTGSVSELADGATSRKVWSSITSMGFSRSMPPTLSRNGVMKSISSPRWNVHSTSAEVALLPAGLSASRRVKT